MAEQVPSIGRIVHYRLDRGPNIGVLRPAIIVRVWSGDCVQLQVFTDAANDGLPPVSWETSRVRGDGNGCWQWPSAVAPSRPIPAPAST